MYLSRAISFFSRWQVQFVILLVHVLLSIIGFYNFIFNYQLSETYLTQNVYDKQQIIAKSGARSVDNFFNNIDNQLLSYVFSFAKDDENLPVDLQLTRIEFKDFIRRSRPPITGITFYDDKGILKVIENSEGNHIGEGVDFSSSDFVSWSRDPQNNNQVYITKPFISAAGSTQGQIIMAVATPVYFSNRFKGTLTIRFLVSQFKSAFIDPLTTQVEENSFIVDSDGVLIAGDVDLLNRNLVDYARQNRWKNYNDFVTKFISILNKDSVNTIWDFAFPNQIARTYLISSSKINIPNTDRTFHLVITTPQSGILQPLSPLRYYGIVWILISLILTLAGGVIYVIVRRVSKAD